MRQERYLPVHFKAQPEPPGFFEGGSIKYKGEEIITKTDREMRKIRGVEIGFIFQDPMTR